MAYATITDLIERFSEEEVNALAPTSNGGIDDKKINSAIADADATIDSYLSAKYSTPIVGVPSIKAVACDLARYNLYDNQAPEQVEKRQKDRLAWLKDIATGKATLGALEVEQTRSATAVVTRTSDDRLFTRNSMSSY